MYAYMVTTRYFNQMTQVVDSPKLHKCCICFVILDKIQLWRFFFLNFSLQLESHHLILGEPGINFSTFWCLLTLT